MDLAFKAMEFARRAHAKQVRKYTGNPYADHLAEVAGIVATVQHEFMVPPGVMLAVAWLHDCVEDQGVSLQEIDDRFGCTVAIGVSGLSDLEEGNRAERKAAGVPFLFKQWGEWAPYDRGVNEGGSLETPFSLDEPIQKFGKKLSGRLLDSRTWDGVPTP